MACFVVPAVEAVAVTAAYLAAKKHEQKISAPKLADGNEAPKAEANITWSKRLSWLMGLLWAEFCCLRLSISGTVRLYPSRPS